MAAMFPDTTKANQELGDLLAYIALLRREGYSNNLMGAVVRRHKSLRPA